MASIQQLRSMTLEEAVASVLNSVYMATALIESLERQGRLRGSGHRARQAIAKFAAEQLRRQWIPPTQ